MINPMKQLQKFSPKEYTKNNPLKAKAIKKAVKQGVKQYAETFKRLASV